MNTQSRPGSLPRSAAVIAAAITAAPFLYGFYGLAKGSWLYTDILAMNLSNLISSLVYRTGLVFLIVLWHGEQRDRLAFRRPALLLTIYASCLVAWEIAQILMFRALIQHLNGGSAMTNFIVTMSTLLNAALYALVAWLTWRFITHILRKDALPLAPPGNARRRVAGLAAWLFASVLVSLMTQATPMLLDYFDDDLKLVMLNYIGAIAVPTALVFAGAMRGLPSDLGRLHGWRLLGASLVAMASVSLLGYGAVRVLGNMPGTVNLRSGMLTVTLLAGIGVAHRVWFRVFYAAVRRPAAEISQGVQSS
jgi:hypothetical protein